MKLSKHNIFSKIRDSENYFLVNLLSRQADIISACEARDYLQQQNGKLTDNKQFAVEMAEKGYLTEEVAEESLFRGKYLDFLDSRDKDEIQVFYVTNYSCNFACSYCYQDQYKPPAVYESTEVIDAFFSFLRNYYPSRKLYITLFGGEPLLGNSNQKKTISHFINRCKENNLELCVVTNGYHLKEYIPILVRGRIREVQVTLDGTEKVHDRRRYLKGGKGTFQAITNGIDACLAAGIPVNLRMVIDRENIDDLPALAQYAIDRGWTANRLFKTQIGRNYELHHCQAEPDILFDRLSLYERIYELSACHPHILSFHKPGYSIARHLAENGELPEPLFDSCPACKTEIAFDCTGNIYPCTATVGKSDESLGTFYPVTGIDDEKIAGWEERDVTSIPQCRDCALQLACGGGCGSVAKNRTGTVCSPDCRPVKELLELGFAAYFT